ncbi:MAG: hypothetical protein ATN36_07935 [Epulopiscium sp. Nele67-Bin005]|nr:MAG: hypothetical protein ATN36_07935 [Epulopiscium sp. Nele67-Bin005]
MNNEKRTLTQLIRIIFNMLIVSLLITTTTLQVLNLNTLLVSDAEKVITNNTMIATAEFNGWMKNQLATLTTLKNDIQVLELYNNLDDKNNFDKMEKLLASHVKDSFDIAMIYIATDAKAFPNSDGWVGPSDYDPTTRGWYIGAMNSNSFYLTAPYIDANSGELVITLAEKLVNERNQPVGVLGLDIKMTILEEVILSLSSDDGTYLFIIDENEEIIIHPNPDFQTSDTKTVTLSSTGGDYGSMLGKPEGTVHKITTSFGDVAYSKFKSIPDIPWRIISNYPARYVTQQLWEEILSAFVICILAIVIGGFVISKFTRRYISPIEKSVKAITQIKEGQLTIDTSDISRDSYEINILVGVIDDLSHALTTYIKEISYILSSFAQGDFTKEPTQVYVGDFKEIQVSMIDIRKTLSELLTETNISSNEVNAGANQITQSAYQLANLTIEQSQLLHEFRDSTLGVTQDIINSIGQIDKSYKIIKDVTHKAKDGKEVVNEMVNSMQQITNSTEQISEVITAIDAIADQTNLLALNAAIESARAGEAGKGFAIVANEVRDLAAKTSEIVQEIYDMIKVNLESVQQGERMVALTSQSLDAIVGASVESVELSKLVRDNALEQKLSLEQVVEGTERLSTEISKNTSISQENVAVSEELSARATLLENQMSNFIIK